METYQLAYSGEQLDEAIENVVSTVTRSVWYRPPDYPNYDALQLGPDDPPCAFFTFDTLIPIDESEKKANLTWYFYGTSAKLARIDRGHIEDGTFVVDECVVENAPLAGLSPYEIQLPLDKGQYVSYRISHGDPNVSGAVFKITNKSSPCVETYIHRGGDLPAQQRGGESVTNHTRLYTLRYGKFEGGTSEFWNPGVAVPDIIIYDHLWDNIEFGYMPFNGLGIKCKALYITNSKLKMGNNAQNSFNNSSGLHTLDFTGTTIVATNLQNCFSNCSNLRKLDLSGWDMSGVTKTTSAFYKMTSLVDLILPEMPALSFSLSDSTKLSVDSLVGVIASLPVLTDGTTATLTLGATNTAKLTAEQLSIATEKGWTVA